MIKKVLGSLNQLKNRLFLVYILTFTLLTVMISISLIIILNRVMINEVGSGRVDLLRQIGERSNVVKNSSITISNLYMIDSELLSALNGDLNESEEQDVKVYLNRVKAKYDIVFNDVGISYDVVVIGDNGFNYSSQAADDYNFEAFKKQLWYKTIYEKINDITFISSFRDVFGTDKNKYVFSASKIIRNSMGEEIGTLLINVDETYLANLYASSLNGSNVIYIIDKNGSIISHANKNMRGMHFINIDNFKRLYEFNKFHIIEKSMGKYLLSNYYDAQTGWTIIEEMPLTAVTSEINQLFFVIFIIMSICLLIAVVISYYTSVKISKPIINLCGSMEQVKEGNFDVISNIQGYSEINHLKDSFNSMAKEIKKLLINIQIEEEYKRQIELDFLRAQINPHFLYNTLFSIKCSAELGKQKQVVDMLNAFTELLKMTLRGDADLITLNEEFTITEKYLILQKMRYQDNLFFEFELDEDTNNLLVPALILQPIVENAIFHGVQSKNDMGIIIVSSSIQDGNLVISITDDGKGMNQDKVNKLAHECNSNLYRKSESIGISNVAHRIKINFGEEYGLNIESELGIGTNVTVILPIITHRNR